MSIIRQKTSSPIDFQLLDRGIGSFKVQSYFYDEARFGTNIAAAIDYLKNKRTARFEEFKSDYPDFEQRILSLLELTEGLKVALEYELEKSFIDRILGELKEWYTGNGDFCGRLRLLGRKYSDFYVKFQADLKSLVTEGYINPDEINEAIENSLRAGAIDFPQNFLDEGIPVWSNFGWKKRRYIRAHVDTIIAFNTLNNILLTSIGEQVCKGLSAINLNKEWQVEGQKASAESLLQYYSEEGSGERTFDSFDRFFKTEAYQDYLAESLYTESEGDSDSDTASTNFSGTTSSASGTGNSVETVIETYEYEGKPSSFGTLDDWFVAELPELPAE